MPEPDFYLDDVQDYYYDVLVIGGRPEKDAKKLTRQKFKLKTVEVSPVGRVIRTVPELTQRPPPPPPPMMGGAPSGSTGTPPGEVQEDQEI